LQTIDRRHCGAHQGEPILGLGDDPRPLLLPRNVRNHEHHDIEIEFVGHVDRRDEMPDVRRIERAAEEADTSCRPATDEIACFGVPDPGDMSLITPEIRHDPPLYGRISQKPPNRVEEGLTDLLL
jgi:hypothetical protein